MIIDRLVVDEVQIGETSYIRFDAEEWYKFTGINLERLNNVVTSNLEAEFKNNV